MERPRLVRSAPLLVIFTTLALAPSAGFAQTAAADPPGRVELGLHVSWLRQSDLDTMPAGFGGRATFDLSRWVGIEAEVTAFPNDDYTITNAIAFVPEYAITTHRSRLNGVFGARAGARSGRVGVFALARPGFTRVKAGDVECVGPGCAIILLVRPTYRTEFVFDYGGAVELYFPSGATIRVDATDTVIRHRSQAPPCASCTTHNFTMRAGIGVRF
jgi:hypothetical protein